MADEHKRRRERRRSHEPQLDTPYAHFTEQVRLGRIAVGDVIRVNLGPNMRGGTLPEPCDCPAADGLNNLQHRASCAFLTTAASAELPGELLPPPEAIGDGEVIELPPQQRRGGSDSWWRIYAIVPEPAEILTLTNDHDHYVPHGQVKLVPARWTVKTGKPVLRKDRVQQWTWAPWAIQDRISQTEADQLGRVGNLVRKVRQTRRMVVFWSERMNSLWSRRPGTQPQAGWHDAREKLHDYTKRLQRLQKRLREAK